MKTNGREARLQKSCMDWCKAQNMLAVNIHGGGWGNKGFPDLLVFKGGRVVAVELKNGNTYTQQPPQKMWQKRFEKVNTPYLLIHSLEEFTQSIERIFQK